MNEIINNYLRWNEVQSIRFGIINIYYECDLFSIVRDIKTNKPRAFDRRGNELNQSQFERLISLKAFW
jgi:hypothetical protein